MTRPTVYHIPVCPFCQRIEILLALKGRRDEVDFHVVDITKPRADWLLAKTRGTTALPVFELADGRILKESLVIMRYLDECWPDRPVAQPDPYRRAVEGMLTRLEGDLTVRGYTWVMNQDPAKRDAERNAMLAQYRRLNDFLVEHAPAGPFLFETFGWAEAVPRSLCIACADRVAVGIDRWQGARCSRYWSIDKPSNAASDRFRRNPPGRRPSGRLTLSAQPLCATSTRRPGPSPHPPGRPPSRPRRLCRGSLTPLFARFWFLEYYEDFQLPDDPAYARVRQWVDACLAHPAAQQASKEEIVKLYYDYAKGAGNGALLPGRRVSSFTFEPHWRERAWPPKDKYMVSATDEALGLTA